MARYANGRIPGSAFVRIASGTDAGGRWEHLLSPSMLRKHNDLVARARKRTGRTLAITPGWGAYRPFEAQVAYKKIYGSGAAAAGYSSHGGFYNGKDTLAADYGNWGWVYNWDTQAFFDDARAAGYAAGEIKNEPWHVIDYDPWAAVPSGDTKEKIEVKHYHRQDVNARGAGRVLAAGQAFWLNTTKGAPTKNASNIVGGIGTYSITPHVYAEGKPGDQLELQLFWDNTKTTGPHSGHYVEQLVLGKDGTVRASREFKRAVASGYAVYARLRASDSNAGNVKVTMFDSDSFLFIA